jgi:hypothetical protein
MPVRSSANVSLEKTFSALIAGGLALDPAGTIGG